MPGDAAEDPGPEAQCAKRRPVFGRPSKALSTAGRLSTVAYLWSSGASVAAGKRLGRLRDRLRGTPRCSRCFSCA